MQDFQAAFANPTPGRHRARIPLGTSATGTELGIPVTVLRGASPGPCLWINGQVHGDELNGILATFDLLDAVDPSALRGSVVLSTTANPFALEARRKKTPADEEDLDQAYPGRADGLPTQRLAAALFPLIAGHADVTICMHSVGTHYDGHPYAVYKVHPGSGVDEATLLRLTAHFDPVISCRMSVDAGGKELPGNIAGALDYQLLARGRTAFMLEIGGGGRAEPPFIARTTKGLLALMTSMGMLAGPLPSLPRTLTRATVRGHVTCDRGGFARTTVRPGTIVRAGEPILHIRDAWGEPAETITQDRDIFVISLRRDPVMHSGDRAAFVAWEWDEVTIG